MAGVIQIITRTGRGAPRGVMALQAGSYGRREASASVSGGGAGAAWSLALSHLRTDGVLAFNNSHENTVLTGTARLRPDSLTRVGLSVRLADRSYHFPTDASGAVSDHNAFTYGNEATVSVSAAHRLHRRMELRARLGFAQDDGGTDDQPDSPADTMGSFAFTSMDHVQRVTADLRTDMALGAATATVGLDVEREGQRSFSQAWSQWGTTPGQSMNRRWNRAAYAHLTGSSGPASWAAGGRLEDNERFGRAGTWNLGLTWRLLRGTRIRVSAGTAVKEPTFYENFAQGYVRGNPDLEPERASSWDGGLDQSLLGGRLLLRGTYFDQAFENLIQYTATPAGPDDPNFFNLARSRARGVEVGASLRMEAVHADADWTWLDTRVVDGGVDGGPGGEFAAGQPLLRRPRHALRINAGVDASWGGVWGGVRVVGSRQDRDFSVYPSERVRLDGYTDVDVGAELPVRAPGSGGPGLTLTMRAENLLDAGYEEVFGFPAPGRAVYVGGRVLLGGR
jgi:vitamin B12 transporter